MAPVSAPVVLPYETASWGRRALALLVDWFACMAVVSLFSPVLGTPGGPGGFYTLLLFVVESAVLTCTVGGSFGKLLTRLRTVRVDGGGHLDPLRSLARAILVALVIPPLVFRPDRRGLHDLAAGTATVTLQVALSRRGQ
nr:RDD family protein [Nocardioides soli]